MTDAIDPDRNTATASPLWLKRYYAVRALFSALWVVLALTIGKSHAAVGIALLVSYPAWDSVANYVDAMRNARARTPSLQILNAVVSAVIAIAIAIAAVAGLGVHATIGVIGIWAALSGVLQLAVGVHRWRSVSAQWPQILSGGLSCVAGAHFISRAMTPSTVVDVATVAPYAAFGALFFAISVGVLVFKSRRQGSIEEPR